MIAALAAVYARKQVAEARITREEQAQPFVLVDFQPSRVGSIFMDLVIKNTGATLARNVRVMFDPPLRASVHETAPSRDVALSAMLTRGIPTLPPGVEHRSLFERMPTLHDREDLPRQYEAVVTFNDSRQREYTLRYELDLEIYFGRASLRERGVHDIAEELHSIDKHIRNLADRPSDTLGGSVIQRPFP